MQIECSKHMQFYTQFCIEPSCKIPICDKCSGEHKNHKIMSPNNFAEYLLKQIQIKQNEISAILSDTDDLHKTAQNSLKTQSQKLSENTHDLLNLTKTIIPNLYSKSLQTLEKTLSFIKTSSSHEKSAFLLSQREKLNEMKSALILSKENEHFSGIQEIYKQFENFCNTSENTGNILSGNDQEILNSMIKSYEEISEISQNFIKKLEQINSFANQNVQDIKKLSFHSHENITEIPKKCSICLKESPSEMYLILECKHGVCQKCAYNELEDKISSKGIKVIENDIECGICFLESCPTHIIHKDCGCVINSKKSNLIYQYDRDNSKFSWPKCGQKVNLSQTDIFFIHGSRAFTFFDECMPLAKLSEISGEFNEYQCMALCKELTKENVEIVGKILAKSLNINNIIWRGQRLQSLMPGIFYALESVCSKLQTLNLSTNSLGDIGVKYLCQMHGIPDNLSSLDICIFYIFSTFKS